MLFETLGVLKNRKVQLSHQKAYLIGTDLETMESIQELVLVCFTHVTKVRDGLVSTRPTKVSLTQ